jgi:Uma2 family endonuclease
MRLMPGQVRIPDVAFISQERIEQCSNFDRPIPDLTPDLAIEIVSENNTPAEIDRKIKEYFFAGTALVWVVDPRQLLVTVYTAPDQFTTLHEQETLTGEPAIPGLRLPVARVFSQTLRPLPKRPRRKKKS